MFAQTEPTLPEVETAPAWIVAPDEDGEVQEWVVAPEEEPEKPSHGCGCGSNWEDDDNDE